MDKYKKISKVSRMPAAEILAHAERLRSLEMDPEDIRSNINNRDMVQRHRRAGWDVVRGLALLTAVIALAALAPSLTSAGQTIAIIAMIVGAAFVVLGLSNRQVLRQRLRHARTLRQRVEGADGFLWRFQTLLEYRDADGPVTIHDSLIRCCQASQRCEDVGERQHLVEYFYWLALVEMHLVIAEKCLHDDGLDPYEAGSHG